MVSHVFSETSISQSLMFGLDPTEYTKTGAGDMREDLGAALVQVKEDGVPTHAWV